MMPKRDLGTVVLDALNMGREELFAKVDNDLRKFRQKLLDQLANTMGTSAQLDGTLVLFEPESPDTIAAAQRDLRTIWSRVTPFERRQRLVDAWLAVATKRVGRAGIHAWLGRGCLEFDFNSFPGQFVMAVLENWWRFQVCGNPDCPAKYFLAQRNTQRYCERGECTKYAQRRHALNYWTTKGKFRRKTEEEGDAKTAKRTKPGR